LRFSSEVYSLFFVELCLTSNSDPQFIVQSIIDNSRSGSFADLEHSFVKSDGRGEQQHSSGIFDHFGTVGCPFSGRGLLNELISLDVTPIAGS